MLPWRIQFKNTVTPLVEFYDERVKGVEHLYLLKTQLLSI